MHVVNTKYKIPTKKIASTKVPLSLDVTNQETYIYLHLIFYS